MQRPVEIQPADIVRALFEGNAGLDHQFSKGDIAAEIFLGPFRATQRLFAQLLGFLILALKEELADPADAGKDPPPVLLRVHLAGPQAVDVELDTLALGATIDHRAHFPVAHRHTVFLPHGAAGAPRPLLRLEGGRLVLQDLVGVQGHAREEEAKN